MAKEPYSPEMLEKYYKMRGRAEKFRPKQQPKPHHEVKAAAPKTEPEKKPQAETKEEKGLELWKGKRIRVYMRNGQTFEGLLKEIWKYEFWLETSNQTILVFKHACDYVEALS
jgi:sRNA-binding regulator protein Hfq